MTSHLKINSLKAYVQVALMKFFNVPLNFHLTTNLVVKVLCWLGGVMCCCFKCELKEEVGEPCRSWGMWIWIGPGIPLQSHGEMGAVPSRWWPWDGWKQFLCCKMSELIVPTCTVTLGTAQRASAFLPLSGKAQIYMEKRGCKWEWL